MPFDSIKDSAVADPLVSRPSRIPTPLMAAGVAGACVLGAGLGLWARPTNIDNGMPASRPAAVAPARPPAPQQIEIRVDRPPAPAPELAPAAAAEVAPPPAPTADAAPPAEASPAPLSPTQPPEGLVKVRAVVPAKLAEEAPPKPVAESRKASAAPVAAAAAAAARKKAEAARAREARKEADEARAAREEAEVAAARKRRQEKARLAAVETEARERAETKAREKAERRLAEQRAAERIAEKKAAVRLAERKAAERRLAEKAAAEKKRVQLAAQKAARPAAPAVQTVKVVRAGPPRCASADPGAALACNDPSLGAADRRLARAYREAQEAGVPPERLERQQRRWLQARANAARQAPWAVHDIYLARIAELEDQAREAERQEY